LVDAWRDIFLRGLTATGFRALRNACSRNGYPRAALRDWQIRVAALWHYDELFPVDVAKAPRQPHSTRRTSFPMDVEPRMSSETLLLTFDLDFAQLMA